MDVENENEIVTKNQTHVERRSDRELVLTRTFNAPAKVVFDAWTKPELVMRWWAPRSYGLKMITCEIDLRVGGKYRYVFVGKGDTQHAFWGTYKEIERPTRLVSTDEEESLDGQAVTTSTFTESTGRTTVVVHQLFASKESLDAAARGVEAGTRETFEQLEELLAATKLSGG
ncbi:MAG: SRPBCC family protein [Polyangiaceae bacterium]